MLIVTMHSLFIENVNVIVSFCCMFNVAIGYLRKKMSNMVIYKMVWKTVINKRLFHVKFFKEKGQEGEFSCALMRIFIMPILYLRGH